MEGISQLGRLHRKVQVLGYAHRADHGRRRNMAGGERPEVERRVVRDNGAGAPRQVVGQPGTGFRLGSALGQIGGGHAGYGQRAPGAAVGGQGKIGFEQRGADVRAGVCDGGGLAR